jgi:predicted flap endonuclease-1-like 5' DNA nuclease
VVLAAAKGRGRLLGGDRGYRPGHGPDATAAASARRQEAEQAAHRLALELEQLEAEGITGLAAMARALTERGVATPRRGAAWTHTTVDRVRKRAAFAATERACLRPQSCEAVS